MIAVHCANTNATLARMKKILTKSVLLPTAKIFLVEDMKVACSISSIKIFWQPNSFSLATSCGSLMQPIHHQSA